VHNAHVPPGSSNGWLKIAVLRKIHARLANLSDTPRILCGDFNTPQTELRDGQVITWGQRLRASGAWEPAQRFRGGSGEEWDAAERAVLIGLSHFDLEDSFRFLHGYTREEHSWYSGAWGKQIGRRFDHIFASRCLRVRRCEYLHDVRTDRLSDHSAIEADFDWPTSAASSPV
jgi:endonuclease/exonuclease/phosphatase family metal-dependent hydrolase